MIKVQKVMAEGFFHADKTKQISNNPQERPPSGDTVTISEEGKKRRVMGHVMASLSGPDTRKV
ncbi:MAG: hypothetical protein IT362_04570 [Deltaproteobacteria bacterium]|nr:hypothetical protein [Deltaproteobacteria bacterium]